MSENQLQDHTKLIHLINGVCRGIEIDAAENLEKNFPDHITIQGEKVEKNIAFSAHTLVLPSVLLRSDIILQSTYGKPIWNMLYEKNELSLAGFQSMGDINLDSGMLKVSALGAALTDMSEVSPDGSLDFTRSLMEMKSIVHSYEQDTFVSGDIINAFSVKVVKNSIDNLNTTVLSKEDDNHETSRLKGGDHA